jgi:hypothetical protein
MMTKLKTFWHRWISKKTKINTERPSNNARPFFEFSYIMDPIKQFMHQLNIDAASINKNIVGKSASLNNIEVDRSIYKPAPTAQPNVVQAPIPQQIPVPQVQPQQPVVQTGLSKEELDSFLTRMSSMEKKIDRFFNLIEKRVVKNAKEINIRIKLNELNENTDSEQE